MRTPVTVAVVCGANGLGDALARSFDRLPQASLRWICDDVKRSASIGYGPETAWTMDFDELLQDEDLVAIAFASPGQVEPWRALAALEAEKHVFVDGPLRCPSADAERLVAVATRGNRTLLAQTPALLRPEVLRLHRLIGRGALGEIYYLHARRFALRPDGDFDLLRDLGLDLVALALDLVGDEPVEASAAGESYVGNERPDVVFATLRFATGINAHVHLSCLEGESAERISVVGSKAAAVLDVSDPSRALSVYANGAAPSVFEELPIEPGDRIAYRPAPDDSLRLACSRFVSAVRSHGDVSVGREAAAALAVVEALEQSCRHRGAAESVASRSDQEGKVVAFRAGGVASVTRQLS